MKNVVGFTKKKKNMPFVTHDFLDDFYYLLFHTMDTAHFKKWTVIQNTSSINCAIFHRDISNVVANVTTVELIFELSFRP